jgi:two-component system, LytTR family, response regulator
MSRILLIDDESSARHFLRLALAEHPLTTIVGEAGTMNEARAQLARPDYDLVLLDIQLRGGTGFDLVPLVRAEARIIFVTAYDQHALRAFAVNALDYLLKPVDPARLAESLQRAADPLRASPAGLQVGDIVHVKTGYGTTRFIPLASITVITTSDNYTELTLADGARHFVRRTLKSWEDALPSDTFVRVHRHAIVNLAHLRRADRATDKTTLLTLSGVAEPVRASFHYATELRARLAALDRV